MATAPSKPAPPPAKTPNVSPPAGASVGQSTAPKRKRGYTSGVTQEPLNVCVYGTGGVGKTKLLSLTKQVGLNILFVDLENGTHKVDCCREQGFSSFDEVRELLQDIAYLEPFDGVAITSYTKLEEMAAAWTCANVPHSKTGKTVGNIEAYGWGEGYTNNFETFLKVIGDLDALRRRGKYIFGEAHECEAEVVNPFGDNFKRYEPRLQCPKSGKGSIRHKIKEWVDHLLFIGYDVFVDDNGKAKGSGTRTIYTQEMPTHWAKSRSLSADPIPYADEDAILWKKLLNKE